MLARLHAALTAFLISIGLMHPGAPVYQGYGEGEYVLVAPQIAGTLENLNVARGGTVHKGDPLFTLEHAAETAALEQAVAQAASTEATLDDLLKAKRKPEIDTLLAKRDEARAAVGLSQVNYDRDAEQLKIKAISQAAFDKDKALLDGTHGLLAEAEANLANARLSTGRDDAIRAAAATFDADKAAIAAAQWRLDQKVVTAPADAFVFDTLARAGEFIPTGQAVVSLLPPADIKARFFVPEPELASIPAGAKVTIKCDGCEPIPAHVTYVSPQAEYSPPELYNQENRARLLFMLEATPDEKPERIHPGQPLDVEAVRTEDK